MARAPPLRERGGIHNVVEIDTPEGLLRPRLPDGRAEATEDIIHRSAGRIIDRLDAIKRRAANHQFGMHVRRLSPADRDGAAVALISQQEVKAEAPDEPRRAEDRRCLNLPHSPPL